MITLEKHIVRNSQQYYFIMVNGVYYRDNQGNRVCVAAKSETDEQALLAAKEIIEGLPIVIRGFIGEDLTLTQELCMNNLNLN